eukprot:TRINITY_DN12715_c1_g1_i2.p1 TRINITY_DN12715_c1_g1~~TRINITY_DN12715_c1_g1_i2.p1  ORF type:complete len:577 (+),score=72.72 TRINITY_DN12715_c1_g1_i2:90-1820(+)
MPADLASQLHRLSVLFDARYLTPAQFESAKDAVIAAATVGGGRPCSSGAGEHQWGIEDAPAQPPPRASSARDLGPGEVSAPPPRRLRAATGPATAPRCPGGHGVLSRQRAESVPLSWRGLLACSRCGVEAPAASFVGCRRCDYDLCGKCTAGARSRSSSTRKVPAQPQGAPPSPWEAPFWAPPPAPARWVPPGSPIPDAPASPDARDPPGTWVCGLRSASSRSASRRAAAAGGVPDPRRPEGPRGTLAPRDSEVHSAPPPAARSIGNTPPPHAPPPLPQASADTPPASAPPPPAEPERRAGEGAAGGAQGIQLADGANHDRPDALPAPEAEMRAVVEAAVARSAGQPVSARLLRQELEQHYGLPADGLKAHRTVIHQWAVAAAEDHAASPAPAPAPPPAALPETAAPAPAPAAPPPAGPAPTPAPAAVSAPPAAPAPAGAAAPPEAAQALQRVSTDSDADFESDTGSAIDLSAMAAETAFPQPQPPAGPPGRVPLSPAVKAPPQPQQQPHVPPMPPQMPQQHLPQVPRPPHPGALKGATLPPQHKAPPASPASSPAPQRKPGTLPIPAPARSTPPR